MGTEQDRDYFDKVKALHAGAAAIAKTSSRDDLYDRVIYTINTLLKYPYVTIAVPKGDYFEIVKSIYDLSPEQRHVPMEAPSLFKRVYDTGKTRRVDDVTQAGDYYRSSIDWHMVPVLSVLLVPVHIEDRIEAIIIIDSEKRHDFTELDTDIFEILSMHMSSAFSRINTFEGLTEIEDQNQAIMKQAQDAVVLIDFDDKIKFWNPAAELMFGFDTEEIIGKTFFDTLVSESQKKKYNRTSSSLKQLGLGDKLPAMECVCFNKAGIEFGVDVSHSLVMLQGVPHILRMIRYNSERKRYEERLQALYTHISRLAEAKTDYDIAVLTREAASGVFGVNHGSIALKKGEYLEYLMNPDPEKRFRIHLSGKGISVRAFKTGEIQLVHDVTKDPSYVEDDTSEYMVPTLSELDVPIRLDDEIIGVVNVEASQKNKFTESDVRLISILAENVAHTIKRIKGDEKRLQYEKKLEALHNSAIKLRKAQSKDELYSWITGIIEDILGFHWIGVAEPGLEGLRYVRITEQDLPDIVIPYDTKSITVRAYKTRQTLLVPDVTKDPDYIRVSDDSNVYRSELVVPIKIEDEIISLINIEATEEITETDRKLMEIVAIHLESELERLKNEETIREDGQRLRKINENAVDAILIINAEREVTHWNPSSERLFGYKSEYVIGRNIENLIIPSDHVETFRKEFQMMIDGIIEISTKAMESVACRSDGEEFALGYTTSIVSIKGEPHLLFIARDITQQKRVEEQLQQLNKELARSNEDLENYTYVVSHDLKAPLRSIRSFSSFLLEDYGDRFEGDGKEYLNRIVAAVTRMDNLISDLLIISRIGRKFTDITEIDLNKLLKNIQLDLSATIQAKNAKIIVEDLPTIEGQTIWISQLFTNLISNGLKFNDSRSPVIKIACERRTHDVLFSVTDNGIGIPKEYQESIFKLFERLHTTEEYEGTGAGLTICRKIDENVGGKIWVESEVGKGSTFYFTYPIKL